MCSKHEAKFILGLHISTQAVCMRSINFHVAFGNYIHSKLWNIFTATPLCHCTIVVCKYSCNNHKIDIVIIYQGHIFCNITDNQSLRITALKIKSYWRIYQSKSIDMHHTLYVRHCTFQTRNVAINKASSRNVTTFCSMTLMWSHVYSLLTKCQITNFIYTMTASNL